MNRKESEQNLTADTGLDEALARMAEEVPPMPADFHDRWMNAVRAEARNAAPEAENVDAPEGRRTVSMTNLTRILSIAAVFVFLIGGTLIHRSLKRSLSSSAYTTGNRKTAESAAGIPDEPLLADSAEDTDAEEALMMDACIQAAAEEETEEEAEGAYAPKAGGAFSNAFVPGMAAESAYKADDAEEAACEAAEAHFAGEAAYEAAPATAVPTQVVTAAPTPVSTASPTATSAPTPEPTPEMTPEPTPGLTPEPETSGFLQAAGAFFTDMGDFLAAALPYLLVLAVPGVIALVIRRKKKEREEN